MLCFVHHWQGRTFRKLAQFSGAPEHRIWSYDRLFRSAKLPTATWIFTDFDRLSVWDLELAAHVYRELAQRGMRVLNDPATALPRFALLKSLQQRGINRFAVWRVDEAAAMDRWPVFVRTEAAHRGPLTDLIHTPDGLHQALEEAITSGHPVRDLMIVEYCAKPLREGLFRKHAAFRVGERIVNTLSVHDSQWAAKFGQMGIAGSELYREELENIRHNAHATILMQAFEIAGLEYGRVDYAMVDGQPQIYEINSNPTIGRALVHPDPNRIESSRIAEQLFSEALCAIDSAPGPSVRMMDATLAKQRRKDRFRLGSRWAI